MGRAKTQVKRGSSGVLNAPQNVPGAMKPPNGKGRPSGLGQFDGTERPDAPTDVYEPGGTPRQPDIAPRIWKS